MGGMFIQLLSEAIIDILAKHKANTCNSYCLSTTKLVFVLSYINSYGYLHQAFIDRQLRIYNVQISHAQKAGITDIVDQGL